MPQIQALGATLATVTPVRREYARQLIKKLGLTFPMLLDPGNRTASAFQLTFSFSEALRNVYRELGLDLERYNGDDSWTLAMPASYLVDSAGTVRYAEVNPDYTQRPEPEEVLAAVKTL